MTWFTSRVIGTMAYCSLLSDIGCFGLSAKDFIESCGEAQRIELFVNSTGGCSSTARELSEFFRTRHTEVIVTGHCWSSGLFSILGAKKIQAYPGAQFLLHSPVDHAVGTPAELRHAADRLEKLVKTPDAHAMREDAVKF